MRNEYWQWLRPTFETKRRVLRNSSPCSQLKALDWVIGQLNCYGLSERRKEVDKAVITTEIRLRHDYDVSHAPASIRRDSTRAKKMNVSIFRRSCIVCSRIASNHNCDIGLQRYELGKCGNTSPIHAQHARVVIDLFCPTTYTKLVPLQSTQSGTNELFGHFAHARCGSAPKAVDRHPLRVPRHLDQL